MPQIRLNLRTTGQPPPTKHSGQADRYADRPGRGEATRPKRRLLGACAPVSIRRRAPRPPRPAARWPAYPPVPLGLEFECSLSRVAHDRPRGASRRSLGTPSPSARHHGHHRTTPVPPALHQAGVQRAGDRPRAGGLVGDKRIRCLILPGLLRPSRVSRPIRIPMDAIERFLRETR